VSDWTEGLRVALFLAMALLWAGAPGTGVAQAQSPGALAEACQAGAAPRAERCALVAATAHALQGGLGLLLGAGGPFPASPSTAGQRLHGSPRYLFDAGMGLASFTHPDLASSGAPERRRTAVAPRLSVGVGVFEGVSPAPTIGGLGALDLVGELRLLPVPTFDGLDGRSWAWGVGARIGVVRESFSLPGITLSAMHRRSGALDYRSVTQASAGVTVAPRVTSFRAVVGKDLMELGVSGGIQRDRIRGDATVHATAAGDPGGGSGTGRGSLPVDRTTWFVGVNRTWVVSQVALELGWSPAPDSPRGIPAVIYDGPAGGVAGALTFRVLY
jgi:hypothetical protein